MNNESFHEANSPWHAFTSSVSPWEMDLTKFSVFFFLAVCMLTGVIGNVCLIRAVLKFRRIREERPHCHLYLLSLALADLAVCSLVMPLALHTILAQGWVLGFTLCHLFQGLSIYLCAVSNLHLALIAFDRLLAVTRPAQHSDMEAREVIIAIAACWLVPHLVSYAPLTAGMLVKGFEVVTFLGGRCTVVLNYVFAIPAWLISFVIPILAVALFNLSTYLVIRQSASWPVTSGERAAHRYTPNCLSPAARTLALMAGTFALAWGLFTAVLGLLIARGRGFLPDILYQVALWMGYLNSAVNPLVYLWVSVPLRRVFCRCGSLREDGTDEPWVDKLGVAVQTDSLSLDTYTLLTESLPTFRVGEKAESAMQAAVPGPVCMRGK